MEIERIKLPAAEKTHPRIVLVVQAPFKNVTLFSIISASGRYESSRVKRRDNTRYLVGQQHQTAFAFHSFSLALRSISDTIA